MELFLKINTLVTAMMCLSVAGLLFALKFPLSDALESYKTSRKVMAFVYLSLGIGNLIHLIYLMSGEVSTYGKFDYAITAGVYIIVSSWQSLLITYSLLVLIDAYYVTTKRIIKQIVPVSVFSSLIIAGFYIGNLLYLKNLITAFLVYYLFQLVYYTLLFFRKEEKFRNDADNFFSDGEIRRVKWVRIAFLSALGVGVWAFIIVLFPEVALLERLFSVTVIILYLYFGLKYLNYVPTFHLLKPVIAQKQESEATEVEALLGLKEKELNEKIQQWIKDKSFAKSGITICSLAEQLNTNRTYLSNYINSQKNMTFNRWLNSLRIEEAKRLMSENPDLPLGELIYRVGYTEQSCFSKQFAMIEGCSPSHWKDRH